ncbi:peptidylprolyl isomerase [Cellvibrio japonicus]|uniref:Peptidyl-prolyl cis-trans isomerase n=1 Tax=Cellvibrio japonicus (strain Ueda107) TaxID=498211 RepID=B3PFS7_CELJU|nr:peptidylprolyl isomerase [Cellvibrio japonicus]ACE86007.1 peptidyl-prolyl cis-trans isomerase A (PPIaseA) (Rotamase A) (Cyclophilin A) [Cellvibrio japonicus Ueda107]QEI12300.1 peptidyl-prolyl cis-trans isomerase [Cellvibrio japonicus]QEI15874.1 peptidyl-prolyl cis-trans isomerase [Cellvibrio japonicus]QEI19452.1 peptidyl-prolyl cis-trans isomerase [Cellvibrio japonicus]
MITLFTRLLVSTGLLFLGASLATAADNPKVELKTDHGTVIIELYPKQAPITVQNFLEYVDSNFYDGTIFHRVVPGFVVQGGGMTFDFTEKPTRDPINNESDNGLRNEYKTVAMARHSNPNSATSQFYINLKGNPGLNATEKRPGYTVFGKVIDGMEVIEKIAQEPRGMFKAHPEAPNYAVRILSAKRYDPSSSATSSSTSPLVNSRIKDALVKPQ